MNNKSSKKSKHLENSYFRDEGEYLYKSMKESRDYQKNKYFDDCFCKKVQKDNYEIFRKNFDNTTDKFLQNIHEFPINIDSDDYLGFELKDNYIKKVKKMRKIKDKKEFEKYYEQFKYNIINTTDLETISIDSDDDNIYTNTNTNTTNEYDKLKETHRHLELMKDKEIQLIEKRIELNKKEIKLIKLKLLEKK